MPKPKIDPERIFANGKSYRKYLYRVTVNWYGQIFKLYRWANSYSSLMTYISKDLSPKVELNWTKVRCILTDEGMGDTIKIELVSGPEN